MTLTAAEQYLLELINRARLDPSAEARRYGIDLNQGLAAASISTASKQVLAPNELLESAASQHALWLLDVDTFSHTGIRGSQPADRATTAGYKWSWVGENLSWRGTTERLSPNDEIERHHRDLFLSASHRENMMNANFREVGLAQEIGRFTTGGRTYNASMLDEMFGKSGDDRFVTGVVYEDTNRNGFYDMGEGRGGASFSVGRISDVAELAGGYSVAVGLSDASKYTLVNGISGSLAFSVKLDMTAGNAKLDLIGSSLLKSSVSLTLVDGIGRSQLIGLNNANLTGNNSANVLTGNAGGNILAGMMGNDSISGLLGNDGIYGGAGNDTLIGGYGRDTIEGGTGKDVIAGGIGADRFVFRNGAETDRVTDFELGVDRLSLGHMNWSGTLTATEVVNRFAVVTLEGVVFQFDLKDHLILAGLTSTVGLAASIDII